MTYTIITCLPGQNDSTAICGAVRVVVLSRQISAGVKFERKTDLLANTLDIRPDCRHNHMLGP
jgi:hypothetical protein